MIDETQKAAMLAYKADLEDINLDGLEAALGYITEEIDEATRWQEALVARIQQLKEEGE